MPRSNKGTKFADVFASVNSHHVWVNYADIAGLGQVHESDDENHDSIPHLRIKRHLPTTMAKAVMCFARPRQSMSLGNAALLAMNFGFRPAIHHETAEALKLAVSEQIDGLFTLVDDAFRGQITSRPGSLTITCLATSVNGKKKGELIPVHQVMRGHDQRFLHLRQLDFDAPMPPAQLLALVEV